MPRRALRKADPQLDLSRHFKTFEELPAPWDPAALFPSGADLELEIGSGKGLFIQTAAAAHPERNFLGIEMAPKYAKHAAARLARLGLTNAVMVAGDALRIVRELIPDDSLSAVHVYFPDPWWKARHKKRRVVNEHSVRDIQRTLRPGGSLHFWTDVEEYFHTGVDLIRQFTTLRGPLEVSERAPEHDLDYRTHFERRTRLHGLPVYRSEFRKGA